MAQINRRLAQERDLPELVALLADAKRQMQAEGFQQWTEDYPNQSHLLEDIRHGELWLYGEDVKIAVTIERQGPLWSLHRMMVHSSIQNLGWASRLLTDMINRAADEGASALHVTTHSQNKPMRVVLQKFGFEVSRSFLMPDRRTLGLFLAYQRPIHNFDELSRYRQGEVVENNGTPFEIRSSL